VFYTSPRAEKVVHQKLCLEGYEAFLPLARTLKTWKNRQKKVVEQALFPGYIFVYTEERYFYEICQFPKILTYIQCGVNFL